MFSGSGRRNILKTNFSSIVDSCTVPEFELIQPLLHQDAQRSLEIPNAGGSSDISEALSMQYMFHMHGATSFVAEMEVPYWLEYKICDYLMKVRGREEYVGVSVTRAVPFPFYEPYTIERARELLQRKLYGLIVAQECVREDFGFSRCILHVWCSSKQAATQILLAHQEIVESGTDESLTYDDVELICTVCTSRYLYTNKTY